MTESMIVEAVRSAMGPDRMAETGGPAGAAGVSRTADPAAVEKFQAAMGVEKTGGVDPVPFASEASAVWRSARENNQGILHRIRALSQLDKMHGPSIAQLAELQYEVANLAFQQEVVTKVVDKSSNAIQTLIKNQ